MLPWIPGHFHALRYVVTETTAIYQLVTQFCVGMVLYFIVQLSIHNKLAKLSPVNMAKMKLTKELAKLSLVNMEK